MDNNYTGRKIAIFTDIHGLLEPLEAIVNYCKENGITEIYSLGDNIGEGPNPKEVLDLIIKSNIKTINGNAEDYVTLGIEPFSSYIKGTRLDSVKWTELQLTKEQKNFLKTRRHSIDLEIGGKKVGLCHFINDPRFDYKRFPYSRYQKNYEYYKDSAILQFYEQNSESQKNIIEEHILRNTPEDKGYFSAFQEPLFEGKTIDKYDEIIQGHVHFRSEVEDDKVKVTTLRAAGMAYGIDENLNEACFIVIKEKNNGYDVEEKFVEYDRDKMLESIEKSNMPFKDKINKYVGNDDENIKKAI